LIIIEVIIFPIINKKMFYVLKMTDLEAGKEKLRLEEKMKEDIKKRDSSNHQ